MCSKIRTSTFLENTWASFWGRNCASPKWLLLSRLHHHSCPWKTFSSILCNILSSKVIIEERYIDDAAERWHFYWIKYETFNKLYTIAFNLCKQVSSFFNEIVTIRKPPIQKILENWVLIRSIFTNLGYHWMLDRLSYQGRLCCMATRQKLCFLSFSLNSNSSHKKLWCERIVDRAEGLKMSRQIVLWGS